MIRALSTDINIVQTALTMLQRRRLHVAARRREALFWTATPIRHQSPYKHCLQTTALFLLKGDVSETPRFRVQMLS